MAPLHWQPKFDEIWGDSIFEETLENNYYELYDTDFFRPRVKVVDEVVNFPYYLSLLSVRNPFAHFPSTDIF